jgi:hypothetical protein
MEKKIFSDEEVFEQIKPKSRKAFEKCWKEFNELNPEINFEEGPPGEEVIVYFFKHPRFEKKVASSSIWTLYSYLNSCRCRVLYGAVGGILWLEKRIHVPGVHLFQQASHLGHGKQAWGV